MSERVVFLSVWSVDHQLFLWQSCKAYFRHSTEKIKCLSNDVDEGQRREQNIKFKSIIYFDGVWNAVQNSLVAYFFSFFSLDQNSIFLLMCH